MKFIKKTGCLFFCMLALHAWAATPEVRIADVPLFNGEGNVHPNLLLSLSVEFPTVGIAYRGNGGVYDKTQEYIGYFNSAKCYDYNGGNRNLAENGELAQLGYFTIRKDADPVTHECGGDSFSGNFMNWVSASAIDMLRYALTGGDRVYDKGGTTILQRAVLADNTTANFYAHSTYFPLRTLTGGGNASAPKQVTPFDTRTLYIVSCRNRILFSDANSGVAGNREQQKATEYCAAAYDPRNRDKPETTDKRLGEYLARVMVCDGNEGPARRALCQKYGSHYKPVGAIQRNASRLRLAAMGYLLDDSAQRYGGVLRAPMKYVGPKKFEAPNFLEVDNDKPEWNPDTGEFLANPDGDTTVSRSGVINYLNQFGRNAVYKRYDPVSELYYEGIRYLQGKGPTAEATADMTPAMQDGFPVIKDWTDPVIASCQRNYIVSIADVNTHWDRYVPGNTRTTYGNNVDAQDRARSAESLVSGKTPALDVKTWTEEVGKMEVGRNANLSNLHTRDTGSGGHGTYYMAGLAYWANTRDIRLDKKTRVKTFAIDVDEGGNGLIDGNTRTIKPRDSQLYLAAKYGGQASKGSDCDTSGDTPPNYFLASQPKEMIRSIQTVFDTIGGASGTISGVSVSTTRISSDGVFVFQPGFDSSNWCGSLKKLALTLNQDGELTIASSPAWDAGEILTGKGAVAAQPKPEDRQIYTSATINGSFLSPIAFKWGSEAATGKEGLTDAHKALLNASPVDGTPDGRGANRVNYLRGDRSLELRRSGGIFRTRGSVLGDIVNSNPVYVGAPGLRAQGEGYDKFRETHQGRTKAVYVGANDGMLHAFDAENGKELFAYAPDALVPKLNQLTRPDYVHRPYVDGMLTVAEARVSSEWKTVLAAGMGGGAQGVFALDITNPSSFGTGSGALFEFTDADDPDMGNVMSAPLIAKFRTGVDAKGIPVYKYFVVVTGGLNNYKDDGANRHNPEAVGALFLLSLDKAPGQAWQKGVNYYKITTPNTDDTAQSGLSAPALVMNANGVVQYAYGGDLQGNLWRINFTGTEPWSTALPKPALLFTAKDGNEKRQPITTQPRVVFAPGGYLVLFGTGKFVENGDAAPGNFTTQSFYGVFDSTLSEYKVAGRSELVKRVLEKADNGTSLQISGDAFSYQASRGWYVDFLNAAKTGERSVTNALVVDGRLYFNTLIPGADPCAQGGGRTYVLSTLTGLPSNGVTGWLSTVGMLSAPVVFDVSAEVSKRNSVGRRTVKKTKSVFAFGTGGAASVPVGGGAGTGTSNSEPPLHAGRFSWREILNWQDLRSRVNRNR